MGSDRSADVRAQSSAALAASDFAAATEAARKGVPINERMGLTTGSVEDGVVGLSMELPEEGRGSAPGSIHGGILATFADTASAICLAGAYDMAADIPVTT